jgi:hypothetical protein
MNKILQLIVILIILVILAYYYKYKYGADVHVKKEGFRVDSQNFVYNNTFENADRLEYGEKEMAGQFQTAPKAVAGPSSQSGVGQNSGQDVYDNRGFKWAANAKDPDVDVITATIDDAQLRNKFERTYLLDPDGSVAQYDITNNTVSPGCCPAQYAPPFKVSDKESNCDFAQQFVANQYSGMNYQDGYGCVCITPKQADFYGSRGGNTD